MFSKVDTLKSFDKEVYATILKENRRQEENLELIASENYVSYAVMDAQGSQLTNKYAEGYPGKRYYGGCEYVDIIENIAIERLKKLFNAKYVNVQPHSGSQANQAVYTSILKPGDTILGMSLAHGGHLTHGASVNISGKLYNAVSYGLDDFEMINYKQILELAHKHQPKIIVAGASAYSLTFDWQKFKDIADEVDAFLLVDMAHYAGLIAAGEYPNPVPIADFVTTTTHKTLRGPRGGAILCKDDTFAKQLNLSIFPSLQGGPLMHVIAAKAVCFKEAATESFREYIIQVKKNAKLLANTLKNRKFRIVSGTTESHMFLLDLQQKKITGKDAEAILGNANITVNKNAIPNDPQTPFITSGIRLGTAAITTRGFKEKEIEIIGNLMADVLDNPDNTDVHDRTRKEVIKLCKRFPVYQSTLNI